MSLRRISSLIVTAVMVSATIAACSQPGGTKPLGTFKKRVSATIFFVPDETEPRNKCRAKVSPYRLQPKNNEWADWTVVDGCGVTAGYTRPVRVTFTTNAAYCGGESVIPNNYVEGTYNFSAEVNNKCKPTETFNYVVSVGGTDYVDPELEIAM